MPPKTTNSQYLDPRYGCSRCDNNNLPGLGYLDRLKKGTTLSKQQYSLQKHVETYHPDVTDWMSLKVDLAKVPRPGTRKRKAAQTSRQEDEDEEQEADDDNGDQHNGHDDDYQDVDEDEDVAASDRDDVRARKVARRISSTSSTEPLRARPLTRSTDLLASATTQSMLEVPTAVVPILPLLPREIRAGYVQPAQTTVHTASVGDLRQQNIQLAASIQDYRKVNDTLARQVQGLLRALTNVVDEELHAYPLSTLAVQNALMHWTRADGQLVEQILGRVTAELHTRRQTPPSAPVHASGLVLGPAQPVAPRSAPDMASSQVIDSSDSSLFDAPSDMEM